MFRQSDVGVDRDNSRRERRRELRYPKSQRNSLVRSQNIADGDRATENTSESSLDWIRPHRETRP